MRRSDRVLEYVRKMTRQHPAGVTAEQVAEALGLARSNASADLNALWKAGRREKSPGRPVRYRPAGGSVPVAAGPAIRPPAAATPGHEVPPEDPFQALVGWKDSLASAVKQAKAAVLYPGGGLHTLICGPTGVGKSRLAELMFQFACQAGAFQPGARFVTFNCADYATNPQLLMAHLFGVKKGAYTGADQDHVGLVEHVHGGMLFLDEVHRLPPEGQEMLFRLIDKGLFRRLGETEMERTSRTLIVCATTERVDSALLRTFTRRIPMVINLPSLADRTLRERLKFLKRAFRAEARKMGVPLLIRANALQHLLLYDCPGNVGQLNSDVQLACAQAFLRYLNDHKVPVSIGLDVLPDHVKRQVVAVRRHHAEMEELLAAYPGGMEVHPADAPVPEEPEASLPNFYEMMERETRRLAGAAQSREAIQQHLTATVEAHFRQFLSTVQRRYEANRQELTAVVDAEVLAAVEQAVAYAEGRLRRVMPMRVVFGLALHINAALERIRLGMTVPYPPTEPIRAEHPEEYAAAVTMVRMLSERLQVSLPEGEAAYMTLFIRADEEAAGARRIALVVACHGQGIAQGMADVAEHLAGKVGVIALDMPLDGNPDDVLDKLVTALRQESYAGVMLLVDMGSLSFLAEKLQYATGLPVRVMPMATTILLIEAIQQVQLPGVTLDEVYDAVAEGQRRLLAMQAGNDNQASAVITCCFTGEGNATLLQQVVQRAMRARGHSVAVLATSIPPSGDWERMFKTLLQGRRPLAVVGPVNPGIPGIPYFASVEILTQAGQDRLAALVESRAAPAGPEVLMADDPPAEDLARTLATGVEDDFVFTNPHTLFPEVARTVDALAAAAGAQLPGDMRVGLVMHLACLVERLAGERDRAQDPAPVSPEVAGLARCLAPLAQRFRIRFGAEDLFRLREVLHNTLCATD
ncbi:transcriptional regulator with AAA-type ATPase domain/transcriptional regulatory protein LevR [Symbiobacterium terraclitae]|uniref:Transcriptional regulator with AAA-type ATPase domain/transcriptional regulatory protein LevR n=1 Tax=Symbiobacterium terraclitae TaxID=557451 RepID=A0ABS4JX74_9FIRM|nr:sigma-54-dependent transcriptional regulator [Symbiobacterium terraclitae]MBP2020135.1 transcriptional regulator with AAA-type ATPase domain/transcriptional regulatory protein LevR [Symbiobacterium terraclitae]